MTRWLAITTGTLMILAGVGVAYAKPDCSADTFSAEKSCVYGRKSIGLPGIGNQIISKNGTMIFQRLISRIGGKPIHVEAILFRLDDRQTIELPAANITRPDVSCLGGLCTWSWNVAGVMSPQVLQELASAKKLIIGFRGEGQTIEESELKRGGLIFAKFLEDIREHEPGLLGTGPVDGSGGS